MLKAVLLAATAVSQATAGTIKINVGEQGITYSPNSVKAAAGDILEFHFFPGGHDVAMSDFSKACNPAASGGFYSGLFNPKDGESPDVFRVTVNSTDPIFFYCSVPGHCRGGMVGVVNPSSDQTLDAYRNAARSATASSPPGPFGGQIGPAASSSSSSSATGSATGSASRSATSSAGPAQTSPSSGGGTTVASAPGVAPGILAALAGALGAVGVAIFFA